MSDCLSTVHTDQFASVWLFHYCTHKPVNVLLHQYCAHWPVCQCLNVSLLCTLTSLPCLIVSLLCTPTSLPVFECPITVHTDKFCQCSNALLLCTLTSLPVWMSHYCVYQPVCQCLNIPLQSTQTSLPVFECFITVHTSQSASVWMSHYCAHWQVCQCLNVPLLCTLTSLPVFECLAILHLKVFGEKIMSTTAYVTGHSTSLLVRPQHRPVWVGGVQAERWAAVPSCDWKHNTMPSAIIMLGLRTQHTAISCHLPVTQITTHCHLLSHAVTQNTTHCHPPLPCCDWKHNTMPSSITTLWLKTQHNAIFHYHVMTLWLKTQDTAIILYNVVTEDCTRCQLLLPCCNEKRINKAELAAKVWKHLCRSIQKQMLTRL